MRLELSGAADADLTAILDYGIENFGWDAAVRYLRDLDHAFDLLRQHPQAGPVHLSPQPECRSLSCRNHRIYYQLEDDLITVLRVLHTSMDAERWLE
ncbi:type II toxin-antitoxin system RelE/ParE family toxin [Parasphingorhabdus sp.]|uniref:type II toxin-antitoxin system RelE/ParE family toxin n=1 Tax=Parasphingorhabdus sp. TaxID=2709688 RepID=UPI003C7376E1